MVQEKYSESITKVNKINKLCIQYLFCLRCKNELAKKGNFLTCINCTSKYPIEEGIIKMMGKVSPDLQLSIEKWDEEYKGLLKSGKYYEASKNYKEIYLNDTFKQLSEAKKFKDIVYLEIGCGLFFLGQEVAKNCKFIIGVDVCPTALKIAKKMLDKKGIKNYLLVQADILNMPLKDNTIDLIYGGGVIEHFKDTQMSVNELYRVLAKQGVSFNTVPYLNIGSLTYRQLWGNIPNFPVLKQIAEFIHIKLLKANHMIFGYELSFLASTLKRVHKRAGFKKVKVEKFSAQLSFEFLPSFLKTPFVWLANNSRLFWPMVKITATK